MRYNAPRCQQVPEEAAIGVDRPPQRSAPAAGPASSAHPRSPWSAFTRSKELLITLSTPRTPSYHACWSRTRAACSAAAGMNAEGPSSSKPTPKRGGKKAAGGDKAAKKDAGGGGEAAAAAATTPAAKRPKTAAATAGEGKPGGRQQHGETEAVGSALRRHAQHMQPVQWRLITRRSTSACPSHHHPAHASAAGDDEGGGAHQPQYQEAALNMKGQLTRDRELLGGGVSLAVLPAGGVGVGAGRR